MKPRPQYWGESPHLVTVLKTPMGHQIRCQCGWGRTVRRQNALARAAKVRKAIREHLETVTPRLVAYRCKKCGWDFTEPDVAPSTVAEVLEFWQCIHVNCDGRMETVTPITPPPKAPG